MSSQSPLLRPQTTILLLFWLMGRVVLWAGAPFDLRCEYQEVPLAVDTPRPRLGWRLDDARRGARQTACRVQVYSSEEAIAEDRPDVWDSGRVVTGNSSHFEYAGPPLKDGAAYWWRVQVWDADNRVSPWSAVGRWEMGFRGPQAWRAHWIALSTETERREPPGFERARWIWHPEARGKNQTVYLRRSFQIPRGVGIESARVRCTADNSFRLWVNGKAAGESETWERLSTFAVKSFLAPGRNAVAVAASNRDGPCGFLFSLDVVLNDGREVRLVSDKSWRVSEQALGEWKSTGFDDGSWQRARELGAFGCRPWGTLGKTGAPFRSACLRREFSLERAPSRARIRVSGLGAYQLRLNGARVGRDLIAPGWTQFRKRIQYQTYDVTSQLVRGANCLAVLLGNGWWHSRIGGERKQAGRDFPRLLLQLDMDFADGTRRRIVSDESWKGRPGPLLEDDIYDGEVWDAREETPGWDRPGFDDAGWGLAGRAGGPDLDLLVPQAKEPLQVLRELPARKVAEVRPGVYVFDFGVNLTGGVRIRVRGKAGDRITLRHAEVLKADGAIDTANLRSARATDVYVLRGEGVEEWSPQFTYHGFRYVEVNGWPGRPGKDALTACFVSTACPRIGDFTCSSDLINRIQENILRGARGNMFCVPTDCPQRDERLGWTGDAQVFADTMCWNFGAVRFLTKWMRDVRDCRRDDGAVQNVSPTYARGVASPAWGDACIIVPWQVYRHFGDTRIIRENWACMTGWLRFMRRNAKGDLYERDGYGDWIATVKSPKKPISAAYYYYDHLLMAEMADAVGRARDATGYRLEAAKVRTAFNRKYFNARTNQYAGGTQTANLLPLFFGIVPDGRIRPVAANVVRDIQERSGHLSTGFLGTAYINPALTRTGHHAVAWLLAQQTTYPSWGYMVESGATTVWELWNSDRAGPGMNSRNHFALGSVGAWFYESLAGIEIVEPGYRVVRIRPRPVPGLHWVRAQVKTLYGPITCRWEMRPDRFLLEINLPPNTRGTVHLPIFGLHAPVITESGTVVLNNGDRGVPSLPAGVSWRGIQDGSAVFALGAGHYSFGAPGPPPGAFPAPVKR
ncbi:MAG: family 78 glycoside hydrolase catalytic domain [Kiritimatiellaeota bacterium]|nr:family 78 glycoside hydrolase catalytic domain [Kiritimatiellota bacterium]